MPCALCFAPPPPRFDGARRASVASVAGEAQQTETLLQTRRATHRRAATRNSSVALSCHSEEGPCRATDFVQTRPASNNGVAAALDTSWKQSDVMPLGGARWRRQSSDVQMSVGAFQQQRDNKDVVTARRFYKPSFLSVFVSFHNARTAPALFPLPEPQSESSSRACCFLYAPP